jgi:hypothetical protein
MNLYTTVIAVCVALNGAALAQQPTPTKPSPATNAETAPARGTAPSEARPGQQAREQRSPNNLQLLQGFRFTGEAQFQTVS